MKFTYNLISSLAVIYWNIRPTNTVAVVISSTTYKVFTLAGKTNPGFSDGQGTNAQFNQPVGLAVDNLANVYVVDKGNNAIRKISTNGDVTTTFRYESSEFSFQDVSFDMKNNLLAATEISQNAARILSISLKDVKKFENLSFDNLQLNGLDATLKRICSSRIITSKNTWAMHGCTKVVSDKNGNGFLLKNSAGIAIIQKASSTSGFVDFHTLTSQVDAIAVDTENLYIANTGAHTIEKMNIKTKKIEVIAGKSGISGSADGIGVNALFDSPQGLAVDANGYIYVVDSKNSIKKIVKCPTNLDTNAKCDINGFTCNNGYKSKNTYECEKCPIEYPFSDGKTCFTYQVDTLAGTGSEGLYDGQLSSSSFSFPVELAIDDDSKTLYIVDRTYGRIRKIVSNSVSTLVHSLSSPSGIAINRTDGSLLITDGDVNGKVYKYTSTSGLIQVFLQTTFKRPAGIAISRSGDKIIVCSAHENEPAKYSVDNGVTFTAMDIACRKAVFDADEIVYMALDSHFLNNQYPAHSIVKATFINNVWQFQRLDNGEFKRPISLDIDKAGKNLFVADFENNVVRKINIQTKVVEVIAGKVGNFGDVNGYLDNARFHGPHGIALDPNGQIYVAGYYNQKIRRITPQSSEIFSI